jgi:hypothetical protein
MITAQAKAEIRIDQDHGGKRQGSSLSRQAARSIEVSLNCASLPQGLLVCNQKPEHDAAFVVTGMCMSSQNKMLWTLSSRQFTVTNKKEIQPRSVT